MSASENVTGKVASVMQEDRVFPPSAEFASQARIGSLDEYRKIYEEAKQYLEGFWDSRAKVLPW
ncbi:MAG: hypothetical protein ABGW78_10690, partial [Pirellulales bacterium]